MTIGPDEQLCPGIGLREIVQHATEALVHMNAERLEELARCCVTLKRDIEDQGKRTRTVIELQDSRADMELLGRVLRKTRSNLAVLFRLHALRFAEADVLQGSRSAGPADFSGVVMDVFNRRERATEYGDN
jgi:hypothetical protein